MTNSGTHPAVFAGLLGGASWGAPTWAYAVSLDQVAHLASTSLVAQFLLGCMTGVAVSGAAAGLVALSRHHRVHAINRHHLVQATDAPHAEVAPSVPDVEESPWTSSSLSLMHAQMQAEEDQPTDRLERVRTGRIVLEVEDREHELSQASVQPNAPRRARHASVELSASATGAFQRKGGRHFATPSGASTRQSASVGTPSPSFAEKRPAAKHAAPKSVEHKPMPPEPVVQQPAVASFDIPVIEATSSAILEGLPYVKTPALGAAEREALAGLPIIGSAHAALDAATTDVFKRSRAAIAETTEILARSLPDGGPYVSTLSDTRHTLRDLLVKRTKNVREVLAERLSPEAMGSIPQIQRADGSVDDIVPTWFDDKVVPALSPLAAKIDNIDVLVDTPSREAETYESKVRRSSAPTVLISNDAGYGMADFDLANAHASYQVEQNKNKSRASYISTHIAEVDLGVFPERRDVDDLERDDVWEVALEAMGETIRQQEPVFEDMVGGPTTIDDPEGLESSTGLIPFRKRNRRPSTTDPTGYVNYLIAEESSRREVLRARQQPKHAYLRVIEGGTSPLRLRQRQRMEGSASLVASGGRHFAPRYAAQA